MRPRDIYSERRARDRVHNAWRKHKERPRWWFLCFERYLRIAQRSDPDFRLTKDELAEIYLHHSGLDQKEKATVFKDAGAVWDHEQIQEAILKTYENAQQLDEGRVQAGRYYQKHKNKHQVRFVAHRPDAGTEGADLIREMVEFPEPTDGLSLGRDVVELAHLVFVIDTEDQALEEDTE